MGNWHVVLWLFLLSVLPAQAQVRVGIGFPDASIEVRLSSYPALVQIRGYPVYYAPRLEANYFFYDGMYWVYQRDDWYASSWYNGPWALVEPDFVPAYLLRVPVRYYRHPPPHFHGWRSNAPPRWDEHWGRDWSDRRHGWDRWNRRSAPSPAPLPVYQRRYSGDRYPEVTQQLLLQSNNYRYQAQDPVVQQYYPVPRQGESAPRPARRERDRDATYDRAPAPQSSVVPTVQEPRDRPRPPRAQAPQVLREPVASPAPAPRVAREPMPAPAPAPQSAPPAVRAEAPVRGGDRMERASPPHPAQQLPNAAPPQPRAQPPHAEVRRPQAEFQPRSQPAEPRGRREPQKADRGQGQGQDDEREKGNGKEHKR